MFIFTDHVGKKQVTAAFEWKTQRDVELEDWWRNIVALQTSGVWKFERNIMKCLSPMAPILFDCFLFMLLESKLFDEIHTYVCRQIKSYAHNIPHALSWVIFCPISHHFPRHFHISGAGEGAASSSAVGLQSLAKRQFWGLRREVGWTPNDLMVFRWDLYGIYLHDLTCIIYNNI